MDRNILIGRTIVVLFFVTAVVTAIWAMVVINNNRDLARENQSVFGLQAVHKSARHWAETHEGRYPAHMALLWSNQFAQARHFLDSRDLSDTVWTVGGVNAKPFVEEFRDELEQADRLDRTPLQQAVARSSDDPFYRFGDYNFARLPRYHRNAKLVFGWTMPAQDGRRFVVFDDGEAKKVDVDGWAEIWRADAAERAALGLPLVDAPSE